MVFEAKKDFKRSLTGSTCKDPRARAGFGSKQGTPGRKAGGGEPFTSEGWRGQGKPQAPPSPSRPQDHTGKPVSRGSLFPKVSAAHRNAHGFSVYVFTNKIESVIGVLGAITPFCEAQGWVTGLQVLL